MPPKKHRNPDLYKAADQKPNAPFFNTNSVKDALRAEKSGKESELYGMLTSKKALRLLFVVAMDDTRDVNAVHNVWGLKSKRHDVKKTVDGQVYAQERPLKDSPDSPSRMKHRYTKQFVVDSIGLLANGQTTGPVTGTTHLEAKKELNKVLKRLYGPTLRPTMPRNAPMIRRNFPMFFLPFFAPKMTLAELYALRMSESLKILVAVVLGLLMPGPPLLAFHQGRVSGERTNKRWPLPSLYHIVTKVVRKAGGGCGLGVARLRDLVEVVGSAVMFIRDDEPPCCKKQDLLFNTLAPLFRTHFLREGSVLGGIGAVHSEEEEEEDDHST